MRKARGSRHGGFSAVTLTPDLWTTDFLLVHDMEDEASGLTSIGAFVTEAGNPGTNPT